MKGSRKTEFYTRLHHEVAYKPRRCNCVSQNGKRRGRRRALQNF